MGSDMTVPIDDGLLNIRVGAVIMRGGKFLMAGAENIDYLYSVGGRVQFGETAEEAIVREVYEETGVKMEIDRLGFIHENYFVDSHFKSRYDKTIYEISFFFYMKVPEDFEPVCESLDGGGNKEFLVWVTPDDKRKIFPDFFRTELGKPFEGIKHFVTDERRL